MWDLLVVTPIKESITFLSHAIASVGIPYPFGFGIILFTLIIKLITLPLNIQQMRAAKALQDLQPKLQELQKKYGKDREKLAQEQMKLYREANVNPLAGCLPSLIQLPIWIGLYQALFKMAQEGILAEGFFFIPSLAKPVGMGWLWPPSAWHWPDMPAYLVLPILTLVTQLLVQKMSSPPTTDPQQAAMNQMMYFFPFMLFFFALQVPSGLSLYWVVMNLFTMVQQYIFMQGWKKPIIAGRKTHGERTKKP